MSYLPVCSNYVPVSIYMYGSTNAGSDSAMLTRSQKVAGYNLELLRLKEMVLRVIYTMS